MASKAQVEANRAHSRKSTGPKTDEGKAVVSRNAVKHGLLAEQVVIAGEDPGEFEFYRQAMMGELSPVGEVESMLAERAVGLAWRLRRAERLQSEVFGTLIASAARANHLKKLARMAMPEKVREGMNKANEGETELGDAVVRDYADYRVLDRLGLYEGRIERSFYRTMGELQKHRVMPEAEPAEARKSEARSTKSETNTNDRNPNDKNETAPAGGSGKPAGLGAGGRGSKPPGWPKLRGSTDKRDRNNLFRRASVIAFLAVQTGQGPGCAPGSHPSSDTERVYPEVFFLEIRPKNG